MVHLNGYDQQCTLQLAITIVVGVYKYIIEENNFLTGKLSPCVVSGHMHTTT